MQREETKKILTIDDEDALRRSIQMFFEDEGFEVYEADNGLDGLEVYREHLPDVVLVDLRMPQMDGLEVIKVLAVEAAKWVTGSEIIRCNHVDRTSVMAPVSRTKTTMATKLRRKKISRSC